jgi:glycosyltransferase involved in cell wall biosynthesis
MAPLLSVIIISHNQKEVLRRCIESVLAQRVTFPMEVIVSDDRSTDGTREMLVTEFGNKLISTFCNSDDCTPSYTFERAGYNRLNGLRIARGKYIIHVDGDDMFVNDDVFQKQVDILEKNSECSICVQNYKVADCEKIDGAEEAIDSSVFKGNPILTADEFILRIGYVHNSACCMRKSCLDSSLFVPLEGKTYDDVDITFRYLGTNKVALLDCANFVYVQYPTSFCHVTKSTDWSIIAVSGLLGIRYIPQLSETILQKHYNGVWGLAKMAWKRVRVSEQLIDYYKNDDIFIFRVFDNKYPLKNWLRVSLILIWLIPIRFWGVKNKLSWRVLYRLSIR